MKARLLAGDALLYFPPLTVTLVAKALPRTSASKGFYFLKNYSAQP